MINHSCTVCELNTMVKQQGHHTHSPHAADKINTTKVDLFYTAGFLNVIGAIVGRKAFIKSIIPYSEDPFIYQKREHTYSINTQVMCDAQ